MSGDGGQRYELPDGTAPVFMSDEYIRSVAGLYGIADEPGLARLGDIMSAVVSAFRSIPTVGDDDAW